MHTHVPIHKYNISFYLCVELTIVNEIFVIDIHNYYLYTSEAFEGPRENYIYGIRTDYTYVNIC